MPALDREQAKALLRRLYHCAQMPAAAATASGDEGCIDTPRHRPSAAYEAYRAACPPPPPTYSAPDRQR